MAAARQGFILKQTDVGFPGITGNATTNWKIPLPNTCYKERVPSKYHQAIGIFSIPTYMHTKPNKGLMKNQFHGHHTLHPQFFQSIPI